MNKTNLAVSIETLLESSYGQLASNSDVFFDTPRKEMSNQVQLSNIQMIPAVESGQLVVKAETRGKHSTYTTTIEFSKVDYKRVNTPYAVNIGTEGEELKIAPISAMQNTARFSCQCMDFYWRFALHNHKDDSLIGKPPAPYVKKTDRAPQNPQKVPGVCKHLMAIANHLRLKKIIK